MRAVRPTIAIVFGIFWMLTAAPPALAGGPTSVLLAAPGSNAVGLYNDDPEYAELVKLVDAYDTDVSGRSDGSQQRYAQGPFVTVTWMMHDTQVWRVDRIYYKAESEPWIYTVDNLRKSSHGRWHRSTDPEQLVDLLRKLDLTGGEYAGPLVPPVFASAPMLASPNELADPPDREGSDAREPAAAHTTDSDEGGWWWAGGGAAAGVIAGAGAVVLYPRVRQSRSRRQQLVDY